MIVTSVRLPGNRGSPPPDVICHHENVITKIPDHYLMRFEFMIISGPCAL